MTLSLHTWQKHPKGAFIWSIASYIDQTVTYHIMRRPNLLLNSVCKHIVGLSLVRRTDVFLASFPRSGSTYLRTLVANACCDEKVNSNVNLHNIDDLMLVLGYSSIFQFKHNTLRLVKTHRLKEHLLPVRPRKYVLLVRRPDDVMRSAYRYYSASRNVAFRGSFDDFLCDKKLGLRSWEKHTMSWLSSARSEVMLITYDRLKENPHQVLAETLNYIGRSQLLPNVETAVNNSSLKNMRYTEEKIGYRNHSRFVDDFKSIGGAMSGADLKPSSCESVKLMDCMVSLYEKIEKMEK